MSGDEGTVTRRRVDCGTPVDGYRQPLALVCSHLLRDTPAGVAGTAALVSPTAKTPFPLLVRRLASHHPLYLADPSREDLEWQRSQVGDDQVEYLVGGAAELPDSLQGLGLVLNPFGLQHWHIEAPLYAPAVRTHCRDDAHLVTLDWGATSYPEALAGLPGIAEEVRFSEQALLPPYGVETGWRLVGELEVTFGLLHSVEDIAVRLHSEHGARLRDAASTLQILTVLVGSSVIYRRYEGVP